MKSKKFRQRYNIPEPPQQNNNSSVNDVDEEQTIGEIMRAMHVLRQVPITPSVGGNFSSIPEIADDNIFFNKSIGENAAISDAEALRTNQTFWRSWLKSNSTRVPLLLLMTNIKVKMTQMFRCLL